MDKQSTSSIKNAEENKRVKRAASDTIFVSIKRKRIEGPQIDFEYIRYGPLDLIERANYYYEKKDLIQASIRLWLSASYVVKILFLKCEVMIVSHSAVREMCLYAIRESPLNKKESVDAFIGWDLAEFFHRFTNGGKIIKGTYDANKEEVVNFVHIFLRIKPCHVKRNLDDFLKNSPKVGYDENVGKVTVGGTEYKTLLDCLINIEIFFFDCAFLSSL